MIEINQLSKHFGANAAVDDVTFSVHEGEVLGFLGPNGAGKSTTMKMITGFLSPTSGTVIVSGHDVKSAPIAAQEGIGYLPEGAPLYPDMTPLSLLRFVASVRGMADAGPRIDEVVQLVGLKGVLRQRIETLSKGFKRRVGLALAILHDPPVLVLDEPTDGLDPNQKHEVRELIQRMSPGKVIVLSTHILEEVEAVCTRAIIISDGRVLFDGTPADLRARSRTHLSVELHIAGQDAAQARAALAGLDDVREVEELEGPADLACMRAYPASGRSILKSISRLAQDKGWEVEHMHVEKGHLDEVFRTITCGDGAAPDTGGAPEASQPREETVTA